MGRFWESNIQGLFELIQWLSSLEDRSIIDKLLTLRRKETKDWWDPSSVEEKASIERGISEADNNQLKPHAEAKEVYEKWLYGFLGRNPNSDNAGPQTPAESKAYDSERSKGE